LDVKYNKDIQEAETKFKNEILEIENNKTSKNLEDIQSQLKKNDELKL